MKNFLFILFLFYFSGRCSAQEPAIEINDRAMDVFKPENFLKRSPVSSFSVEKLTYVKDQSIYISISDRKLQEKLMNTRNAEIMHFVSKAKKNRKREFVAFAAVPLGIAAAACIRINNPNAFLLKPVGITFFAASLSCLIISPIANHLKTANYKRAIKVYNMHF